MAASTRHPDRGAGREPDESAPPPPTTRPPSTARLLGRTRAPASGDNPAPTRHAPPPSPPAPRQPVTDLHPFPVVVHLTLLLGSGPGRSNPGQAQPAPAPCAVCTGDHRADPAAAGRLSRAGDHRPRLRALLALLAGDLRTGCGTERLVAGLWPDE